MKILIEQKKNSDETYKTFQVNYDFLDKKVDATFLKSSVSPKKSASFISHHM